jgi:very-short-patch-repair endonuclease
MLESIYSFFSQYGIVIAFLVIILGVLFQVFYVRLEPKPPAYHYGRVEAVLNNSEKKFYLVLKQALMGKGYEIFPKIRMADFLKVKNVNDHSLFWKEQNKILRKHVDFLICDTTNFLPLLVIELDGPTHSKWENQQRDNFKNEALKIANLPLLRVEVQNSYDVQSLGQKIMGLLV